MANKEMPGTRYEEENTQMYSISQRYKCLQGGVYIDRSKIYRNDPVRAVRFLMQSLSSFQFF
jgi:hypothetical protein